LIPLLQEHFKLKPFLKINFDEVRVKKAFIY